MEGLPMEICHKIFCLMDYQSLATAHQVCRKWKLLGSDDNLWSNLYKARWGEHREGLPGSSNSWKYAYEVQDRCYRIGVGLTVTREGDAYYLVHQGEIRRYLGSKRERTEEGSSSGEKEEKSCRGIFDNILFFVGDLEVASHNAKRRKWL